MIDPLTDAASTAPMIEAASRLMQAGRYYEADILVGEVLAEHPGHVDALMLHAVGRLARGAGEPAFEVLAQLATNFPGRADVVANLGAAHAVLNRPEAAIACLEQATMLAPQDVARWAELARLLIGGDDLDAARRAIVRLQELAAAQDDPIKAAEGWSLAALLSMREQRMATAQAALRHALELRPDHLDDITLMSDVLALDGKTEEALVWAEKAYLAAPADHNILVRLAHRLIDRNRLDAAERHMQRVIATAPAHAEAHDTLARILILKGDVAGGLAAFAPIVRRSGGPPTALLAMARLLRLSGDLEKALSFTDEALKRTPEEPEAVLLRAHLLLALGRIEAVWPPRDEISSQAVPLPLTVPLGLPATDVLLLARFAQRLAPMGGSVLSHAETDLLPLLAGIAGLSVTDSPAPEDAFPLTALPERLGVTDDDLGRAPYLAVEASRHTRWQAAMAGLPRPLIGIIWDERAPGLELAALAAALDGRGTLISLIFDARREQLSRHPEIVDAGAHFTDARDLIAAIAHLDLVAGSDGLAQHIAGAMGRPAIVAVAASQPWMWAQKDGRALWYPSVQVVRQSKPGDWSAALEAFASAATELPVGGEYVA